MNPTDSPRSSEHPAPDFRALFESAPGLYLVLAPEFTIVAVSDAYLRATMTARDAILGRGLFEVFPDNPDDPAATGVANLRASLDRVVARLIPDAMAVQKYDIRRPESEGGGFEERWWSPVNSPVLDARGRLAYIIHRVEDVTEFVKLKQLEREHGQITAALRTEAARMESEIYRRAQELQDANRQLRELQGELEQRVVARTAELQHEIRERARTEEALKQSEEQFRQAQRLEAIGRLAGGIAHDFNNLLTIILTCSESAAGDPAISARSRKDVEQIHRAGQKAATLTRQLLAFSRQQVLDPQVLDLNEVIESLQSMLARVLGEDVVLELAKSADLGPVRADRGQIEQVLMNLAVNARDAMPRGGTLVLATANVDLDAARAAELSVPRGPYASFAVKDTGSGMDDATRSRIFEPFFTTKERSKGTGLGLSTVFGIVQQSGGTIRVESAPGAGSTFTVYLPRVAAERPAAKTAAAAPPARGNETVLVVEDDDMVREVARAILAHAGYRVLLAAAPDAARVAQENAAELALLVTDVVMPGMNGREVADQVRAAVPGTRVLFMSGYTDDVILHHGVLDSGVAFLQKPITPGQLTGKVREVLDRKE